MTRDDIIRMAKEAGFEADGFGIGIWDSADFNQFAALVAAAEREACAKVCEGIASDIYGMENLREYGECAAAIRARDEAKCEGMRWEHTAIVWTAPQSERGGK